MDKKREMERKRADVLKRLETRSRERREKSEREKEKRAEMEDPRESSDLFWKEFKVSRKEIEDMIESCSKKYEKETRKERRRRRKDPESDPATKDFLNISNVLVGLQKHVTSSSYFLAKYVSHSNVLEYQHSNATLERKQVRSSYCTGERERVGDVATKSQERDSSCQKVYILKRTSKSQER